MTPENMRPEDAAQADPPQQPAARVLPAADPLYRDQPNRDPDEPGLVRTLGRLVLIIALMAIVVVIWRSTQSGQRARQTAVTLVALPDQEIEEGQPLVARARLAGGNLPAAQPRFVLAGEVPEGCTIDTASGEIAWTPSELQGPGEFPVTVGVEFPQDPQLDHTETFTVRVLESNQPPQLAAVADHTIAAGAALRIGLRATDVDVPGNGLQFEFAGKAPAGMTLDRESGSLVWTPSAQSAGEHTIAVRVQDDGQPSASHEVTFSITVSPPPPKPVIALPNHYAFLVAVSGYRPELGLRALRFPEQDIERLVTVLRKQGFLEENILVMSASRAAQGLRYFPSRENIGKELGVFLERREPQDHVLLAFAGHGVQFQDEPFFCPADADLRQEESLLSFTNLYERMKVCRARLKLLLTDACRHDPFNPQSRDIIVDLKIDTRTRPQELKTPGGIAALFACAPGQKAWESEKLQAAPDAPQKGHGVFFHFAIEGLSGAADKNQDDRVGVTELHTYVAKRVEDYVWKEHAAKQTPTLKGKLVGDLPIVGPLPAEADRNEQQTPPE